MRPDIKFEQIEHLLTHDKEFDSVMSAFHEVYEMYFLDRDFDPDAFGDVYHPQNVSGLAIAQHFVGDVEVDRVSLSIRLREYTHSIDGRTNFPTEIHGIPIHVRVIGDVRASAGYQTKRRPAPGGFSAHNAGAIAAGTMGCTVKYGGNIGILSNRHVFVDPTGANTDICQPSRGDGGVTPADNIAVVGPTVAINFGAGANNTVDACIGAVADTSLVAAGVTRGGKNPISIGAGTIAPRLGLGVQKSGRTTGTTRGTVKSPAIVQDINYGTREAPHMAHFINQIEISGVGTNTFGAGGDSGSLVTGQSKNVPVGLYFADNIGSGLSFANPIGAVLTQLTAQAGATVDIQR